MHGVVTTADGNELAVRFFPPQGAPKGAVLIVPAMGKMTRIAPRDVGETRIGHFGFFRPRFEAKLWRAFLLPELG